MPDGSEKLPHYKIYRNTVVKSW